jgi:uncharacterized protein (DUF58 family)
MKRIKTPNLKDLFRFSKDIRDFTKFHEEFQIYNTFTFFIFVSFTLIFVGLFKRECFILGLTLISTLAINYLSLKKLAYGISLKRSGPRRGKEYDKITFHYQIQNKTSFHLSNYTLCDYFTGNHKGSFITDSPVKIESQSITELTHTFLADGGMGEKESHNLTLVLKDPIDLFHFAIIDEESTSFELYTLVENIIPIENRFNQFSYHFGEVDVPARGDSTNFFGARSYRAGDPVKHINWRQTIRTNKTIVNLFEKNINKSFTFLFNTDCRLHSGMGGISTQEYLKDFILAIASQNISNGNEVEVITNNKTSPFGSGKTFINRLELFLYELQLVTDDQAAQFVSNFLKQSKDWENRDRSIIYFTPIVPGPLFEKNIEEIVKIKELGQEVEIVWVDAFSYVDKQLRYGGNISVKHQIIHVKERSDYWKEVCRIKDIPCYHLEITSKEKFPEVVLQAHQNMWRSS